ncbi:MAG: response regulator [Desulfobacteraceae bacterium]|nr:response regulator [Desulfobacteraceae bacterium]
MPNVPNDIKILVVEDAVTMRKLEIKTLKSLGFENIEEAGDGEEAIQKLEQSTDINFIISDWNMPKKGGTSF